MQSDDDSAQGHEARAPEAEPGDTQRRTGPDSVERKLKAMLESGALPSRRPPTVQIGDEIAGTYTLLKLLGRGGMGRVYLAEHARTGGEVALKLIHAARLTDDDAVRRFELEARHTAALHHPNVVRVFDFGTDGDLLYLAMEYVPGESLEHILMQRGPFEWRTVVSIAGQILQALETAHHSDQRIIHRDIKPANVLVSWTEDGPFVKVLDFGIAKALEGPSANTQGAIGSPETMAPEQFDELPLSPATDLYALGCTTYAMICGDLPFTGSYSQLALKHCHEEPPPLDPSVLGVPAELVEWIEWLMQKAPDDRPSSAREALERLQRIDVDREVPDSDERPASQSNSRGAVYGVAGLALMLALGVGAASFLSDSPSPGRTTVPDAGTLDRIDAAPNAVGSARTDSDENFVVRPVERVELTGKHPIHVSPAGDRMAHGGDGVILLDDLEDDRQVRLDVPEGYEVDDVSWFPDGDRLLVTLETETESGLWTVGLTERHWERVVRHAQTGRVSRDGTQLIFENRHNVHLSKIDGTQMRTVASYPQHVTVDELIWLDDDTVLLSLFDLNDNDSMGSIVGLDLRTGDQKVILADQRLLVRGPVPFALVANKRLAYGWAERDVRKGAQVRTVPFDPERLEVLGEPTVVFDGTRERDIVNAFSADRDGRLYFRRLREVPKRYVAPIRRDPIGLGSLQEVPTQVAADWIAEDTWLSAPHDDAGTSLVRWPPESVEPVIGPFDSARLFRIASAGQRSLLALQEDGGDRTTVRMMWFGDFRRLADTGRVLEENLPGWENVIQCDRGSPPRCFSLAFLPGRIELFEVTAQGVGDGPVVSIPGPNPPTRSFDFADGALLVGYHDRVEKYSFEGALRNVWRPPVADTTVLRLQHVAYDQAGGFFVSGMFPQPPTYRMLHVSPESETTTVRTHRDEWMQAKAVSPDGDFLVFGNMSVELEVMEIEFGSGDRTTPSKSPSERPGRP